MTLADIRQHPRDYLVVFGGLAAMMLFLGISCWYLGAIQMCEKNGGVLLGTMQCEPLSCIKDYDVYECGSGVYALRPRFNDTWNLTDGLQHGSG